MLGYIIAAGAAVVFVDRLIRYRRPVRISSPTLGVLNLAGQPGDDASRLDLAALEPIFGAAIRGSEAPPRCSVLLLYCEISPAGVVANSRVGVREIIRDSGAQIVVLALESTVQAYTSAAPSLPFGRAHLMKTMKRNDPQFSRFMARLFAKMKEGARLPDVWPLIAEPQNERGPHIIYLVETSPVLFV